MPNDAPEDAIVAASALKLIELWPTMLDALDGMVQQTVRRGWPEPLARQMIAGVITGPGRTNPPA